MGPIGPGGLGDVQIETGGRRSTVGFLPRGASRFGVHAPGGDVKQKQNTAKRGIKACSALGDNTYESTEARWIVHFIPTRTDGNGSVMRGMS